MPLAEVADYLLETCGIPVLLDARALDEVNISSGTVVTIKLAGISLRSALRLLLRQLDPSLTFTIRDEVLLLTTWEAAEEDLVSRVYDVSDLADNTQHKAIVAVTAESDPFNIYDGIVELVATVVEADSWYEVGGPGLIHVFNGVLVVNQTWAVHIRVAALLATLREVRDGQFKTPPERTPRTATTASERWADEKIKKALDAPTPDLDYEETSLAEVVSDIGEAIEIPILLDVKALDELGISTDTPVTFSVKGISLRSALKLMLRGIDPTLTWAIQDEVLHITTREAAEENMLPVFYPIADLVRAHSSRLGDDATAAYAELIETISSVVATESWDEVGGPGSIFYFVPCQCLVIFQYGEVHPQIEKLLGQLRAILESRKADNPGDQVEPPPTADVPTTMIFQLRNDHLKKIGQHKDAEDAADLAALVKNMVEPSAWKGEESSIQLVDNKLIVRQTWSVQRRVFSFLKSLDLLAADSVSF